MGIALNSFWSNQTFIIFMINTCVTLNECQGQYNLTHYQKRQFPCQEVSVTTDKSVWLQTRSQCDYRREVSVTTDKKCVYRPEGWLQTIHLTTDKKCGYRQVWPQTSVATDKKGDHRQDVLLQTRNVATDKKCGYIQEVWPQTRSVATDT